VTSTPLATLFGGSTSVEFCMARSTQSMRALSWRPLKHVGQPMCRRTLQTRLSGRIVSEDSGMRRCVSRGTGGQNWSRSWRRPALQPALAAKVQRLVGWMLRSSAQRPSSGRCDASAGREATEMPVPGDGSVASETPFSGPATLANSCPFRGCSSQNCC
jgi:hypothetical protein